MKCENCGYKFIIGDIIHEHNDESNYTESIILCDECYHIMFG
jgi:hypothetical protein